MINGMIKLFYGEIVKNEMKDMKNNQYSVSSDKIRKVHQTSSNIDEACLKFARVLMAIILCVFIASINIYIGISISIILILSTKIKSMLTEFILDKYRYKDGLMKISELKIANDIVNENSEIKRNNKQITIILTLIFIGIITEFNIVLTSSILLVLIFTIKGLYSNIK